MTHKVINRTIINKTLKTTINDDRNGVLAEAGLDEPRIRTRKKRRKKYSKRIRIRFRKKCLNTESLAERNIKKLINNIKVPYRVIKTK
jgi:hypothetical protein